MATLLIAHKPLVTRLTLAGEASFCLSALGSAPGLLAASPRLVAKLCLFGSTVHSSQAAMLAMTKPGQSFKVKLSPPLPHFATQVSASKGIGMMWKNSSLSLVLLLARVPFAAALGNLPELMAIGVLIMPLRTCALLHRLVWVTNVSLTPTSHSSIAGHIELRLRSLGASAKLSSTPHRLVLTRVMSSRT